MPEANSTPVASKPVGRYPDQAPGPTPKPKLLDRFREALRSRHYSRRTEQSYCQWVKRFIFFHNKRHPVDMAEAEIKGRVFEVPWILYEWGGSGVLCGNRIRPQSALATRQKS